MANPIAVPGTNVPSGAAVSPGGAQGISGTPAWTLVGGSGFTVPVYGGSVTVTVADTTWMALGEWVYIADASGTGVAGQLVITATTPTSVTLFNPTPATYPLATTAQAGLLTQLSGNTTDFIDGTNNCQPIAPQITSVRLRSFNAVGNPNFEVDQRNVGNLLTNPASTTFINDRWSVGKGSGALGMSWQQAGPQQPGVVPGTNFRISSKQLAAKLTTQQPTLAAGDAYWLQQTIEGAVARELINDVTSLSLLVYSDIANFKFSVAIRDNPATKSLVNLCTVPTAATWTLIQLPNIPAFPTGNFSMLPGSPGYDLVICLAAGSNFIAPSANTWQTGNYLGAPGMSNIGSYPVNTGFVLGFVQHEPGPVCSTLIDKPFSQNLDECLRYFQKTYQYGVLPGTVTQNGMRSWLAFSGAVTAFGPHSFLKPMAKIPTVTFYNYATGAANSVRDGAGGDHASAAAGTVGDSGFPYVSFASAVGSNTSIYGHYTADTGW